MAPRAIVTGAAGLNGQYLVKTAPRWAPEWDVQGLSRAELDLTEWSNLKTRIHALKPDLLIHCAALSRTKACEQDPELANCINVAVAAARRAAYVVSPRVAAPSLIRTMRRALPAEATLKLGACFCRWD